VWDYFLTHFAENPEFLRLGEPVGGDELLQQVIVAVCRSLFTQPALIQARLIRLPEHHFVHGTLYLDDRLSSLLYFEDIHKGMMAVLWSSQPPETKYLRFTGRALYDALNRSQN
jgi:hypothetical protein